MATRSPNAPRNERRHRRRQRDLRHHQQHLSARAADAIGQAQIDLGLAAAGHAVQQRHAELRRRRPARTVRSRRAVLLGRQLARGVGRDVSHRGALERIALVAFVAQHDQAALREPDQTRPA